MRSALLSLLCALALGGCQTAQTGQPEDTRAERATVHPGDAVVSALGTPFYLVFKGVACVASVAIAAPVAGLMALSDSRYAPEIQASLGDGVGQNCGPPYVLRPRQVAEIAAPEPAPPSPPPTGPRPLVPQAKPDPYAPR